MRRICTLLYLLLILLLAYPDAPGARVLSVFDTSPTKVGRRGDEGLANLASDPSPLGLTQVEHDTAASAVPGAAYQDAAYRGILCILGCAVQAGTRISAPMSLATGPVETTTADTRPPTLVLPRLVTAVATAPSGVRVLFTATATDAAGDVAPVTCLPAAGSVFPIGTTRVSCSSTDSHANVATAGFDVSVAPPSTAGRMRGDGRVAAANQEHRFTLSISKPGLRSAVSSFDDDVVTREAGRERHDRFRATLVTSAYFFDAPESTRGGQPGTGIDQLWFEAVGTWNGEAGFTVQAVVVDDGEPGQGADTVALTIRRADGPVVAQVVGSLTKGNIRAERP